MSPDSSYYTARAAEERRLAMATEDSKVRRIHLELAAKYAALVGTNATPAAEAPPEAEQRTA
jgi:hypothetical protein